MRNKLKCMLLLVPTLAIASSLSGTPPYTAISNMIYTDVNGTNHNGILVSDSVGNVFFSSQYGHDFGNAVSSGNPVGANFITPAQGFDRKKGSVLWYKNTTNQPIQVTAVYNKTTHNIDVTASPSIFAPSMVSSGSVQNVVPVPGINDDEYDQAGAVVLSTGSSGQRPLNYYALFGQNQYTFSSFPISNINKIAASTEMLFATNVRGLYGRDLNIGTDINPVLLPKECNSSLSNQSLGKVEFLGALGNYAYLICNYATNAPNQAKLYRYSFLTGSFDAGQLFNQNDRLAAGDAEYKAATYNMADSNYTALRSTIVFLEQSRSTGHINYVNTCSNAQALGSCYGENVSGSALGVGQINGGVMTKEFSPDDKSMVGYSALFVGNSNYIFEVELDLNGNYLDNITY